MKEWAEWRRLPLASPAQLDAATTMYVDYLFRCGEGSAKAKYAIFGTIFCRALGRGAQSLPRARSALRGFARDDPPNSRDPMPLEVMAAIAFWLARRNELEARSAALALVLSFDLFTRPSETLDIKGGDVVIPGVGHDADTSVIVAPSRHADGSRADDRPPRPSKNRQFDDTVLAGVKGFRTLFVRTLLRKMKQRVGPADRIFQALTLPAYKKQLHRATLALRLAPLKLTPHSARHGGASTARYLGELDLREIQRRGQWTAASSVRRYDKAGRLTRQVSLAPADVVNDGDDVLRGSPSALETTLLEALDAVVARRPLVRGAKRR